MNEHANCLEALNKILGETNLIDICPYSELLKITPIKDTFFSWTPKGRRDTYKSEQAGTPYPALDAGSLNQDALVNHVRPIPGSSVQFGSQGVVPIVFKDSKIALHPRSQQMSGNIHLNRQEA